MAADDSQQAPLTADSALTKEEIEQRNLEVVAARSTMMRFRPARA